MKRVLLLLSMLSCLLAQAQKADTGGYTYHEEMVEGG